MNARTMMAFLRSLCRDIDTGSSLEAAVRRAIVPTAIAVSVAPGGCTQTDAEPTTPDPAPPQVESRCDDRSDDDNDGPIDCDDEDCRDWPGCQAAVGRVVPALEDDESQDESGEQCFDGLDNDGNGLIDCDDATCIHDECGPPAQPLYGVPDPPSRRELRRQRRELRRMESS